MKYILLILLLQVSIPSLAYLTQGVENIRNITKELKEAEGLGLQIPQKEKMIKKDLLQLKKNKKTEFDKKISEKIENPTFYQGYLYEIRDGLDKTEKAKIVAKYVLYKKIEEDWKILETTVFNRFGPSTFKNFKAKLIEDLNAAVYVPASKGFSFEVSNWGMAMVYPSLTTVRWKIQFSSKYDQNQLEEGAEKIKIQEEGTGLKNPTLQESDMGDF